MFWHKVVLSLSGRLRYDNARPIEKLYCCCCAAYFITCEMFDTYAENYSIKKVI